MIRYKTSGVCAPYIDVDVEGDIVKKVVFYGGCNGNGQGVAKLVEGMKIDDVIERLQGIKCGYKQTSCPDQLSQALLSVKEGEICK